MISGWKLRQKGKISANLLRWYESDSKAHRKGAMTTVAR